MAKNFTLINKWNRFISNIRNNRFSNWLKGLFVEWSDIPLLLYTDTTDEYIVELGASGTNTNDVVLSNSPVYAKDYRKLGKKEREELMHQVYLTFLKDPEQRVFRFRRVLIYTSTAGK